MSAPVESWIAGPLPRDVRAAIERVAAHPGVARVAVMPDVHLAEEVCVGLAVATRDVLIPAAVGGDIGCGMAAVRVNASAGALAEARVAERVLAGLRRAIPALRHPREKRALPASLGALPLGAGLEPLRERDARWQLGTLGRGNHFVELQADDEGAPWLMLHSGSRAVGQAVRDHHLRGARHERGLAVIDADSDVGRAYLRDLAFARAFAAANREALLEACADVLGETLGAELDRASRIDCDHNHVERELHFGEPLWVHRKGAIPAHAGRPGIIPGSMGAPSFHVEGRGHAASLGTSAHGAGRAMSRSEARTRISPRALERQLRGVWFDRRQLARLVDEAPEAYKDIGAVMRAQRELTRIVRRLRPLLAFKAT